MRSATSELSTGRRHIHTGIIGVLMTWRTRSIPAMAVLVALALALAGCVASPDAWNGPRFVTGPLVSLTTVLWPPPLSLVGLEPGSRVVVHSEVAAEHDRWTSQATYTVPVSGSIDLNVARPQLAPFATADSAGLVWSLTGPQLAPDVAARLWTASVVSVHLAAYADGRALASTVLDLKGLATIVTPSVVLASQLMPAGADDVFSGPDSATGLYYGATVPKKRRSPAVIVFDDGAVGASEAYIAPLLSLFGAGVFVIPVSAAADGIHVASSSDATALSNVLDWLAARPDVDPGRIFVYGSSQSEQLALWAAAHFSRRIFGAFAAGGTTALLCGPPDGTAVVSDSTDQVRCVARSDVVDPFGVPDLRSLAGPVVLACARSDPVLPSACGWQDAVTRARGTHAGDVTIHAEGAGHQITVPPGLPLALPAPPEAQSTEQARVAFWNAVVHTLLRTARS